MPDRSPVSYPTVPETLGYTLKRVFLGKPLITDQLKTEKLSKPVALGVLSPDAISSSAYGTEEILIGLLPFAGLAAFTLVLPITGVILLILLLITASYRQVLLAYTKAGGSYVVARDNFGPRIAQIAAAALLIDYVVTVAVQVAAGTVAVVSAVPALGPYSLAISLVVVAVMAYMNLRGLREAGKPFAVPTYFFIVMVGGMIVFGVLRLLFFGGLPQIDPTHLHGTVPIHRANGLVMGASLLVLLRSFANGGSSLTGVEAISNTVSAIREPAGRNGRIVLTTMACILGFLVAGVSFLAYITHATPFAAGYPSVLSEEAQAVFGHGPVGTALFYLLQIASALILYTGANTSFNGFPYLASFVAADRFLPRQLTTRGHRLVFSNGILLLAVLALVLLAATGGSVNSLVPFYAIGVFTGFAMAGYGMTKHHRTHKEHGWRYKLAINLSAGILSTIVVLIFAIAKFTEGAWLVVIVFPLLVFTLIRLNREYRAEAAILETLRDTLTARPTYAHHTVVLLVGAVDIAVLEAIRYAHGLSANRVQAVHFMIDEDVAQRVQQRWQQFGLTTDLQIIPCPDRRLDHAVQELVIDALTAGDDSEVTVLLPRRSYAPVLGRILHDRTADHIARTVSRIPHAVATIVPFDVQARIREVFPDLPEERLTQTVERLRDKLSEQHHSSPLTPKDRTTIPIEALLTGHRGTIQGHVSAAQHQHSRGKDHTRYTITDESGSLIIEPLPDQAQQLHVGDLVRVTGKTTRHGTEDPVMREPFVETQPHTPSSTRK